MIARSMLTTIASLSMLLFMQMTLAVDADPAAAQKLVQDTQQKMLDEIKQRKTELAGDTKKLYKIVDDIVFPHFNFERMSRLVLGKHWNSAKPAQKEKFQQQFKLLLLRTYANAMLGYSDQKIVNLPLRDNSSNKEDVIIRTEIHQSSGFPIPIDYQLALEKGAWKVYDVKIDDVSLVLNYRTSFSAEIRQGGMDNLLKKLAERNKDASHDAK